MSRSYRDLKVWQDSYTLTKDIYQLCQRLPKTEQFGLTSQLRRCAVSIPSNIAEGQQRNSPKDFRHFLAIARGSAAELSTQLLIVGDVYKLDTAELVEKLESIQKMLYSLQKKL
ncbi:hypothetical protein A3F38_00785 [Candidatus Saccharibacteria bacterium RIFCSPHIGHO2_12_FULL_48_21]|nr:MAG: hypothetical protein A3F38_00785 [Candidatus Saccharibacteria bacterium RIFCSPHIGHO2_12_FULL_48_21]